MKLWQLSISILVLLFVAMTVEWRPSAESQKNIIFKLNQQTNY